jgi:hypothetical protein
MNPKIKVLLNRMPDIINQCRLTKHDSFPLYVRIAALPCYKGQEFEMKYSEINQVLNRMEENHA